MRKLYRDLLLSLLLAATAVGARAADTYTGLLQAKNLAVKMADGTTRYYVLSNERQLRLIFTGDSVVLAGDTLCRADIVSMRHESMQQFALDEDATAIELTTAVTRGMLGLRLTLNLNTWNTFTVPFALTGRQLREAFGSDVQVAEVAALTRDDELTVTFHRLSTATNDIVVEPGAFYLLRPTAKPLLSATQRGSALFDGSRPKGPFYLIPSVSIDRNVPDSPDQRLIRTDDRSNAIRINGTYVALDGNNSLEAPVYTIDDNGLWTQKSTETAVKAFRFWVRERSDAAMRLRFCIDGVEEDITGDETGIGDIVADCYSRATDATYDLQGRRSTLHKSSKPGIYIVGGRKVVIK